MFSTDLLYVHCFTNCDRHKKAGSDGETTETAAGTRGTFQQQQTVEQKHRKMKSFSLAAENLTGKKNIVNSWRRKIDQTTNWSEPTGCCCSMKF